MNREISEEEAELLFWDRLLSISSSVFFWNLSKKRRCWRRSDYLRSRRCEAAIGWSTHLIARAVLLSSPSWIARWGLLVYRDFLYFLLFRLFWSKPIFQNLIFSRFGAWIWDFFAWVLLLFGDFREKFL